MQFATVEIRNYSDWNKVGVMYNIHSVHLTLPNFEDELTVAFIWWMSQAFYSAKLSCPQNTTANPGMSRCKQIDLPDCAFEKNFGTRTKKVILLTLN